MRTGEKWHCSNRVCGSQVVVTESSQLRLTNAIRCACGQVMKKAYVKPVLNRVHLQGTQSSGSCQSDSTIPTCVPVLEEKR